MVPLLLLYNNNTATCDLCFNTLSRHLLSHLKKVILGGIGYLVIDLTRHLSLGDISPDDWRYVQKCMCISGHKWTTGESVQCCEKCSQIEFTVIQRYNIREAFTVNTNAIQMPLADLDSFEDTME